MKISSHKTLQFAGSRLQSFVTGSKLLTAALLLGSLGSQSLLAETYERIQPKLPEDNGIIDLNHAVEAGTAPTKVAGAAANREVRLNTVLIQELTGLSFVVSQEDVQYHGRSDVSGVTADASLAVLSGEEFAQSVAIKYLSQPLTLRKLNELNRDTVDFLRKNGFPVVDVIVPEQDITGGNVQLIVLKGTIGQIEFSGNDYFSSELLAGQLRSTSGSVVTGDTVRGDLNWINRNPFRNVNLLYSRGQNLSETNLNFQVEDRRPIRFYSGYENSGTRSTDPDRLFAGVNWGNAFGLDHQFNYQYTMAPDLNNFYAHSASYVIPITQWRHILSFYGAYSNSTAEIASNILEAEGESYSLGIRYAVPLPGTDQFNHELFGGYEYKYSENALIFGGSSLPENRTEISQFNLGYSAALRDNWGSTSISATAYYSPGQMFSYNDDKDFENVSFEGETNYGYGRLAFERITRLPEDFTLLVSVTGQLSSENLLVSEQLGAGGYSTVRGYQERVANAEEGIVTTLELRTPSFSITRHELFGAKLPGDQLQLLTFWDYANLERHNSDGTTSMPESYSLSSAGVGLRYSMSEHFSLRFDYGWQLKDSAVGESRDSRGHIGLVLSY
jgi:hemolysin activation/secretion protein